MAIAISADPIDSFWLNNTLKIKPDEQLGLVKKLYFDQLPFFKRTQEIVQSVMLREQNSNYKLYYKTGWGFPGHGRGIRMGSGLDRRKQASLFLRTQHRVDCTEPCVRSEDKIAQGHTDSFRIF